MKPKSCYENVASNPFQTEKGVKRAIAYSKL
jgi:hypothetical protein